MLLPTPRRRVQFSYELVAGGGATCSRRTPELRSSSPELRPSSPGDATTGTRCCMHGANEKHMRHQGCSTVATPVHYHQGPASSGDSGHERQRSSSPNPWRQGGHYGCKTWLKQVQGHLIDEGAPPRGDSVVGNKKPADPAAAAADRGCPCFSRCGCLYNDCNKTCLFLLQRLVRYTLARRSNGSR